MTNKEKYKQAFSVLQTSGNLTMEVEKMALLKRKQKRNMAVAAAIIGVVLVGGTSTAYAANVGGIQRIVQIWAKGDQTDAMLEIKDDGSYQMTYEDENGNTVEIGGGGVAIGLFGTERPLTEEEIMEDFNAPDVEYKEDGTVWVYYYDQAIEVTGKFDEEGICHVKLSKGEEILYMTIEYNEGWTTSPYKYMEP